MASSHNSQGVNTQIQKIALSDKAKRFRRRLRHWFIINHRQFQWRETKNSYIVLISEILLQRTQASQVAMHINEFLDQFPTLESLQNGKYRKVLEVLQHLGLAKKADTIMSMAKVLKRQFHNEIPDKPILLESLPGVGPYIAAATACFAFGKKIPVVDTNVVRVLSRYFGVISAKKRPHQDPQFWMLAGLLLFRNHPEDFNRALIDFAALVCTFHKPSCPTCPMKTDCLCAFKVR